jgi:hypothetical protein
MHLYCALLPNHESNFCEWIGVDIHYVWELWEIPTTIYIHTSNLPNRRTMHQPMHRSVQNSCKVSSSSHYSGEQQERFLTLDNAAGAMKLPRRISRTTMALRKASRRYSNEFTGACCCTLWPPFMAPSIPKPFEAPEFVEDKPLRLGCLVTKIPSGQRICSHFPWESTS